MVGMVSGGAPLASIALTVFLVNARHLVYGLSYPLHNVKVSGLRLWRFTPFAMRRLLSTPVPTVMNVRGRAFCG